MFEWFFIFLLFIILIILFVEYSRLRGEVEERARGLFDEWRERELEKAARPGEGYDTFSEWKEMEEKRIREDAIERSTATILGRVGEHLAPIIIASNYGIDPRDMRFIGTPIDFIAFKGLSEGVPEKICFIEVKSGKTVSMTTRERMVKDLVEAGKVEWLLIHLPTEMRMKK